jgi:CRP/FNR family transcriptional activator FtrB
MDAEQGGTGSVAINYDKRTLASLLGMTPENLSRSFSNLSKHGIRNSNRGVVIEDRSALIAFSCPTPLIDG